MGRTEVDSVERMERALAEDTLLEQDFPEMEKQYRRIVWLLGHRQPSSRLPWPCGREEPGEEGREICLVKMAVVMARLDRVDNWFHYFMNVIPFQGRRGSTREEQAALIQELHSIAQGQGQASSTISLHQFKLYTVRHGSTRPHTPPPHCSAGLKELWRSLSSQKSPQEKLMKYFKAIAEAKMVYITPSRIFFPQLSLLHLVLYIVLPYQDSHYLHFQT